MDPGKFLHVVHVTYYTSIVSFTCTGILFLGNSPIDIPLVRLQAEACFYKAAENVARQLENWINCKMTVVNTKMDSVFMTLLHLMRRQRSGYWTNEMSLALWHIFL
jgi:hypothetical protein